MKNFNIKKLTALTLSALMSLSFVACKNDTNASETSNKDALKIGIIQTAEHPSLDEIRTAIVSQLEENMGKDNIEIDYKNALGDMSTINSINAKFVGDEKDMIIAIATPAAQSAMAQTEEIPIVYAAVSSPESAGIEGENITGTSDLIPVDKVFDLALKLTPEIKSVGFVYNSGEANSCFVVEQAKDLLKSKNIETVESTITNSSELQQAAETLAQKCDALFTPIDNTVASAMPVLSDAAKEEKKPLYVGADSLVADGGLATVGINYTVLGKETANIASEILKGKSPSEIPYKVMDQFETIINKETAKTIGVTIPDEILENANLI